MTIKHIHTAVTALVAVSLLLLGLSILFGGGASNVSAVTQFYGLNDLLPVAQAGMLFGFAMLLTATFMLLQQYRIVADWLPFAGLLLLSTLMLLTLLSSQRWIAEHGGFPVIGSGQGVIKYFALLAIACFLYPVKRLSKQTLIYLNYFPVALVLMWIGGMKFLELEARAIVPLVETSPLMSWLYTLFTVQQASNLIGMYDIFFALLLGLGVWLQRPLIILVAVAGCLAVFVMTQTFLFSASGAFSETSLLAGLGQFVIKDLWFIANLMVVTFLSCNSQHAAKSI